MAEPLRIVLLGNSFAERVQLPSLRLAGGNEVIGLAGRDGGKAAATAARWNIPHATDDWRELLELAPDLVIVSTPVDLHAPMARAALEVGAHVLCEKPFTLEAAEARELCELARERGLGGWIDHQLRWNPYRRALRERIHAGFVGEVRHVRMDLVLDDPGFLERPFSWWFQAERGGGVLGALGSHLVDNLRWIFGPVASVRARLGTFLEERRDSGGNARRVTADDHAELWLDLASGVQASLVTSVSTPGASRFLVEVSGTRGTLRLDLEDDLVGGLHGEPLEEIAVEPPPEFGGEADLGLGGAFARCEPLFLRELVAALARGSTEVPEAATFEDGLACVEVLEAARRASASGAASRPR